MNRKLKLWRSFRGLLQSPLASTSPSEVSNSCSYNSISEFRFYSSSSSSDAQSSNLWERRSFHDCLLFSGRTYRSEPAKEVNSGMCWNCNAAPEVTPFLFCESCRSIQPVDCSVDYFQIYGLEKKYELEDENLEGRYKDWQKKLHPDLVHSKSEREKEYAAQQSARVTEAYRTLTNPLSRAIYILRLEGVDVNEEETVTEPELLAEIMEIREAVEEASDSESLNPIKYQMQENMRKWSNTFALAFQNRQFEEALNCIRRMTYYDRVNKEIVKKL